MCVCLCVRCSLCRRLRILSKDTWKCSLVVYCCPSAELTAMDGLVAAMCRAVGCQCSCVWCTNWDPGVHVSSCATAEDIFLGFSATFLWNLLPPLRHDVYNNASVWFLSIFLMPHNLPFASSVGRGADEGSWWHGRHNGGVCWRCPSCTSRSWRTGTQTRRWRGGGVFVSAFSRSLPSFLSEDLE